MGERTSYEPGTFCWVDLATTDPKGAKAFYSGLFGWDLEDMPAGDAGTYTMASLRGLHVAALYELPRERADRGEPPHWMSYVSVQDVDATAKRAEQLGGTVVAPPFDVVESGRQAVIADPESAVFSIWQPKQHFGAGLVNDAGAFSLNQLNTTDPESARTFYGELFGWRSEFVGTGGNSDDSASMPDPPQDYWGLFVGERVNGGLMPMPEQSTGPPNWVAFFTSDDLEASVGEIERLGGKIEVPPRPAGPGRIAVAQDPQGAFFALYEGRVDP